MKNKQFLIVLILTVIITLGATAGVLSAAGSITSPIQAEEVAVKSVSQDIAASGSIHSEHEATLHFQAGGTLVYLPFKEGDSVSVGQNIAALDQRTIADTLKSAVDASKNSQITYDNVYDTNGYRTLDDTGLSVSARRQLETAVNTLDQTQLAVEIQKIAQEQASLVSPINGVITHEDVTTPNVNVTATTSFSVADPTAKVFRANVRASDIDFVSIGGLATIHLDGQDKTISGSIERIYPQKTTLATGEDVYQVDIQASGLQQSSLFGQAGSVVIQSNNQTQALMIPTWAILGHNTVWVLENNRPVLKTVTTGNTHADMTEVTGGLSHEDKVILNPEKVAKENYSVL